MHCTSAGIVRDVNKQCREIIQQIVRKGTDLSGDTNWLLCNSQVPTRLQGKHPRCGLSALCMARDLVQRHTGEDTSTHPAKQEQQLDSLLKLAQLRGFSHQGEMYSAENLAKLGKEFFGLECYVISNGFEDSNFVISEVLSGSAVLVPYDADKNHEPCMENGHRAHWALVTGFLCELQANNFDFTVSMQDTDIPTLFHIIPSPELILPHSCKAQHIYLCAKHGKSRHAAVWSLESVKNSNANLNELDPAKEEQAGNYIVPEEGISVGLCRKIVVISV